MRFALAAWSNDHFEHTLYPLRTPHDERLPRFATKFDCVEADVLHHQHPKRATLEEWVAQTPPGFAFLPKMHKDVTHGKGGAEVAERWLEGLEPLREAGRLGPILLQFPPQLTREKGAPLLQELLGLAEPGAFAVEVRHTSWFTEAFRELLETHEVILAWSTFPKAFTPPWVTGGRGFVRFTGQNFETRGRFVTVADRLDDIMEVRKRLAQASWKECFVVVTNPFEGNAVDSLPRIAAALDGPEAGRRYAREPGGVLFPDAVGAGQQTLF